MLRVLATFVLVVPLFLNGLWMVCADGPAAAESAQPSTETTAAAPHCTKTICPMEKPTTGAICLISSNGDGSSIAALMFAVAPPMVAETLFANVVLGDATVELATAYTSPTLPGSTPPPKA